jgi:LysM repeat protein
MIRFRCTLALLFLSGFLVTPSQAQSPSPAAETSQTTELLTLTRKIDAQNIKIDLLSQQILRLQQEIEHPKATSTSSPIPAAGDGSSPLPVPAAGGSTHVVARGETLTSIAKLHKVGIDELQKYNHIENDRKLQIGQTLAIPGAPGTAPSPSPSASAPNE